MMDTMLADNDDAPFKVVGHGNVTSELELRGREVTPTYQVYDNLEEPTTLPREACISGMTEGRIKCSLLDGIILRIQIMTMK